MCTKYTLYALSLFLCFKFIVYMVHIITLRN